MGLFSRELPDNICLSALNPIMVPTALGIAVTALVKLPGIIKTANELKAAIPEVSRMVNEYTKQMDEAKKAEQQPEKKEEPRNV